VTTGSTEFDVFRVAAANLPEHGRNAIHTDAGAQAAGFPRALVAGVTTYAYLTHAVAAAWGLDWVRGGGGEVRLRSPVFDGDIVECVPTVESDDVVVDARVEGGNPRATFRALRTGGECAPLRAGEPLEPRAIVLEGQWGPDYASRAGDPLPLYEDHGVVHPAVWPSLANHIVHTQVARGSWIHLRSVVRHHALAPSGGTATVSSVVVRRYDRGGERAVLDVHIEVDGVIVASVEHEAIVALPGH
jgi:acyl dehydratase